MKTVLCVGVVAGLVALSGCNISDPDQSVILPVTTLDAPSTVAATNPINVTLTVQTGGCTGFDRIEVQKSEASARIVPWGTNASLGRKDISCPTDVRYETHEVRIDPPFANPYQIIVEQGRMAPATATVQVQ